jgi:type I restriction enzyme M protein
VDFYNTSKLTLTRILEDSASVGGQLRAYLAAFSPNARDVIERFDFTAQIARLDQSNLLYLVMSKFCELDLQPDAVSNVEMGAIYEELIRRSFEAENETAGEHFTPGEVTIRLMMDLLFCDDDAVLRKGVLGTPGG